MLIAMSVAIDGWRPESSAPPPHIDFIKQFVAFGHFHHMKPHIGKTLTRVRGNLCLGLSAGSSLLIATKI